MYKKDRGLTLVEIIVALCLIAVLAIICLSFVVYVTKFSCVRETRLAAANAVYSTLEHLKEIGRVNFGNPDLSSSSPNNPHNNYAGIVLPAGFTVSYNVADGYWPEDPLNVPNNTHVDYKTIAVTCSYGSGCSLTMSGYVVENA